MFHLTTATASGMLTGAVVCHIVINLGKPSPQLIPKNDLGEKKLEKFQWKYYKYYLRRQIFKLIYSSYFLSKKCISVLCSKGERWFHVFK